jgi:hypothetical protein
VEIELAFTGILERERCLYMKNLLRNAVQLRKQHLINKLIKSGIYKKNDKHLYELTLSELEDEYKYIKIDNVGTDVKIGKIKKGLI